MWRIKDGIVLLSIAFAMTVIFILGEIAAMFKSKKL